MKPVHRRAGSVLLWSALFVLLALFARHVDWRASATAARGADLRLLVIAVACNQLSLVLKGVRWWVFLRPLGVRSLGLVLRATYAGASLNNLVVAQGGEAARVLIVARASHVAASRVTSALALERALDAISYLTLLVSAAFTLELPETLHRWRMIAVGVLICCLVAMLALAATSQVREHVRANVATPWERVRSAVHTFGAGVIETATPMRLVLALLLSFGAWALQVATYHTIALATHLPLSLSGSVAAMLAIGISFLFRGTPGNVGIFQVIYAMTAGTFGVERSAAVATALLIQVMQIVPTLMLGTLAARRLAAARAA
jgi:conserved hypothetical protein